MIAGRFSIHRADELDKLICPQVDDFCRAVRLKTVKDYDVILRAMAVTFQVEFDELYLYVLLRTYVREIVFFPETVPYLDIMARRLGVPCMDLDLYIQKHAFGYIVPRRSPWETAEARMASLQREAELVGY